VIASAGREEPTIVVLLALALIFVLCIIFNSICPAPSMTWSAP
jgi:hypothetical protein